MSLYIFFFLILLTYKWFPLAIRWMELQSSGVLGSDLRSLTMKIHHVSQRRTTLAISCYIRRGVTQMESISEICCPDKVSSLRIN